MMPIATRLPRHFAPWAEVVPDCIPTPRVFFQDAKMQVARLSVIVIRSISPGVGACRCPQVEVGDQQRRTARGSVFA